MIPKYMQKNWPKPKLGKEVSTFWGFAEYYLTFISQNSTLMNWLNGIKKPEKFTRNNEVEQEFEELKSAFT